MGAGRRAREQLVDVDSICRALLQQCSECDSFILDNAHARSQDLTVHENLLYSARLRLARTKPLREQLALVEDVLDVLQLRHVAHQVVGSAERRGISGGQRKRVNIGQERTAAAAEGCHCPHYSRGCCCCCWCRSCSCCHNCNCLWACRWELAAKPSLLFLDEVGQG